MKKSGAILMAAIFAITVFWSMSTHIPSVAATPDPGEMLIYELQPSYFSLNDLVDAFDIASPIVTNVSGIIIVNGNATEQYLEYHPMSGSIWYADWSQMYSENYTRDLGVRPENATILAEQFLINNGLWRTNISSSEVGITTTVIYDNATEGTTEIENSLDVIFGFELRLNSTDNVNVTGPGAKIRVSFGPMWPPIGAHWVWREPVASFPVPSITEEEAYYILLDQLKTENVGMGKMVYVTQVRLAYYAEPENLHQQYLQPYYLFDCEVMESDGNRTSLQTQRIPATLFSPQITIDPPFGSRFVVEPGTLMAEVGFEAWDCDGPCDGPDAQIAWEWNDTIISTELAFNYSLPWGVQLHNGLRESDLRPHTITLWVKDSNGSQVSAYTSIIITVLMGDVNGDAKVDMRDIGRAARGFGSYPTHPRWDFMCDINNDHKLDMKDIGGIARQFGETYPLSALSSSAQISYAMLAPVVVALILPVAMSSLKMKDKRKGLAVLLLAATIVGSTFMTSPSFVSAHTGGATSNDDGNLKEIGIESCGQNLATYATVSSTGFRNTMAAAGWTSRFHWKEWWAWEEDFKYRNNGGTDFTWMDTVDFGYWVGHGDPFYISLSSNKDYDKFYFQNARWGGYTGGSSGDAADMEWIALESCLTLKYSDLGHNVFSSSRWRKAFRGVHIVLGFHTVASATYTFGPTVAQYMNWPWYTVRQAWIRATQQVQSSSRYGAYLRAGSSGRNTFYDRINPWNVCLDPYPWSYLAYCNWRC